MAKKNIISSFFSWHFYEKPKFLFQVWENFLSFGSNFFSIPLLFKTFFSPWHRYNWNYPKGFDVAGYLEIFISNLFSHLIGAICRIFLIIIGIIFQILILIAGAIIIMGWLLLSLLLLAGLLFSMGII